MKPPPKQDPFFQRTPNQPQFDHCAELLREKDLNDHLAQSSVDDTLDARRNDYGDFCDNAGYAQRIKDVLRSSPNWELMYDYEKEALEFTASKFGRLLSGEPHKADTYHDVAGYMQLVDTNLRGVRR